MAPKRSEGAYAVIKDGVVTHIESSKLAALEIAVGNQSTVKFVKFGELIATATGERPSSGPDMASTMTGAPSDDRPNADATY